MRRTHRVLSIMVALTVALTSVSAASAEEQFVEATVGTEDTSAAPVTEVVADTTDTTIDDTDVLSDNSVTAALNAMLSETTIIGDDGVDTTVSDVLTDAHLDSERNVPTGDVLVEADVALADPDLLNEPDILDGATVLVDAEVTAEDVLPGTILDGIDGVDVGNVLDANVRASVVLDGGVTLDDVGLIDIGDMLDAGVRNLDSTLNDIAPLDGGVLTDVTVGSILPGDNLSANESAAVADVTVMVGDLSDGELIRGALAEAGGMVVADALDLGSGVDSALCASLGLTPDCDGNNDASVDACVRGALGTTTNACPTGGVGVGGTGGTAGGSPPIASRGDGMSRDGSGLSSGDSGDSARDDFGRTISQELSGEFLAEQEANSLVDTTTFPVAGISEIGTALPMTPSILMAIATILAALGGWVMHAERRLSKA